MSVKIISHRGNLYGPEKENENKPSQVLLAIQKGFDVELDLWVKSNKLFLGHDYPQYEIPLEFLTSNVDKLWIHSKNLESLYFLIKHLPESNYFWHKNDCFTLTSKNYIWTYPGHETTDKSVIVDLRQRPIINGTMFGVCTDYPEGVKNDKSG